MKILFTLNSLRKGGIEKSTLDTSRSLSSFGHDVTIILFNSIFDIETDISDNIICLNTENKRKIARELKKIHTQNKVDVIIHTRHNIKTPFIHNTYYIVHNIISHRLPKKGIFKRWIKLSKHKNELKNKNIICVSRSVYDDVNSLNIKYSSISIINNIYDHKKISDLSKETINFNITNYAINVGSYNKIKRHDILLLAFSKQDKIRTLVMLGSGGSDEIYVKNLVHQLGIENRVIFIKFTSNPYPYIKNATLTIISSDSESFSSVTLESLILGTPVVSTACGGPEEILGEKYKNYICQKGNADELADKIILASKYYPEIAPCIYEKYSPEMIESKYLELMTNKS